MWTIAESSAEMIRVRWNSGVSGHILVSLGTCTHAEVTIGTWEISMKSHGKYIQIKKEREAADPRTPRVSRKVESDRETAGGCRPPHPPLIKAT